VPLFSTRNSSPMVIAAAFWLAMAPMTADSAAAFQGSDGGKVELTYANGADAPSEEIANKLRTDAIFDALAASVSDSIRLPRNLAVEFRNCNEANAFYDPAVHRITMCYELVTAMNQSFAASAESPDEVEAGVLDAMIFFFYHELGHALVHQLDLPITGREEDAVDEMASLLILDGDEEGEGGARLSAAVQQFGEMADKREAMQDIRFWGEHSLDAQRMYNLVCMIYGSNPQLYASLVGEDALPKERADRCPSEYQLRKRSWSRLLGNSLKP
jgi:hypothetical protein